MRTSQKLINKLPPQATIVFALLGSLSAFMTMGCRSNRPPALVYNPPQSAPAATAEDDIPANVSSAIRAHVVKLREMRDLGQISEGEYRSRKTALMSK